MLSVICKVAFGDTIDAEEKLCHGYYIIIFTSNIYP